MIDTQEVYGGFLPHPSHPHAPDLSLFIHGEDQGQGYRALIQDQAGANLIYEHTLGSTLAEIKTYSDALRDSSARAAAFPKNQDYLRVLAEHGRHLYDAVICGPRGRDNIEPAIKHVGVDGTIQISSREFTLPWDLIYDGDIKEEITWEGFWGMRYIIQRTPSVKGRPGDQAVPTVSSNSPYIGLIRNKRLKWVKEIEVPYFQSLSAQGTITLLELEDLLKKNNPDDMKKFMLFWGNGFHVVHAACHGTGGAEHALPYLEISESFPVSKMDISNYGLEISNHPLVILNACETGRGSPMYPSFNIATTLMERGARGVIATEWQIRDKSAAQFAIKLYDSLLAGNELGASFLRARRELLQEGNGIGLLYALYAHPTFRILGASKI